MNSPLVFVKTGQHLPVGNLVISQLVFDNELQIWQPIKKDFLIKLYIQFLDIHAHFCDAPDPGSCKRK